VNSHASSHETDGALVADVLAGRRDRFAELVGRYQAALLRLAVSRLGRRDLAEDAVQETFLCAYKSLASYNSRFSFRTWLWTILLNQCRRSLKRGARQPRVFAWSDHNAASGEASADSWTADEESDTPFAGLLAQERAAELEALLARLPDNQADALRLRFFGELKFHEIAAAMECSLATAKNRVRWGLEALSSMLRDKLVPTVSKSSPSP
jgi:RNA polymerase sigma-70 factor (ECF subfamily)